MTEIPEHLLKRSKERRAALGLPGGEAGDDSATSTPPASPATTPVPAASAPVAAKTEEKPPPPPKPKAPYVLAAERRKRVPYWAMPVIALLPVWGWLYSESTTTPPIQDEQLIEGTEIWNTCAQCHGQNGEGGSGAQLNDGEVLKTFPDPEAMMEWVYLGANDWTGTAQGADYGDPDREGGRQNTLTHAQAMPGFGDLTPEQLAGVTRYVRENISGEIVAEEEVQELYEEWAESAIDNAEKGDLIYKDGPGDADSEARAKQVAEGK